MIERLKDALIIIPAFHVATCFIYLFFYYSAFGQGLVYFSNPADIFSISLGDVAPAYIWLIVGIATSHLIFRHPELGNVFRFDSLSEEERERQRPAFNQSRRFANWTIFSTGLFFATITALYYFSSGFLEFFFFSLSINVFIILLCGWILGRFSLSKTQYDFLSIALLVLSSLMTSALRDAQFDKHWRYDDYRRPHISCQDSLILRNVSEFSLAVRKDNSRILIDQDCKLKFVVSSGKEFVPRPTGAPSEVIARLF